MKRVSLIITTFKYISVADREFTIQPEKNLQEDDGPMKTHPREILLYYNPERSEDKKTLAYAKSISAHVKPYAHKDNPSTPTAWKLILRSLDMHPKSLLNKADPEYQEKLRGKEFDYEGWLHVLQRNPHLIKAPIAIKGTKAVLVNTPTDILRLETQSK